MKLSFFTTLSFSVAAQIFAANQSISSNYEDDFRSQKDFSQEKENFDPKQKDFNFGPMLKINGDKITVNKKVLDNTLFKDCLKLVEYMYFGTKRYDKNKRIYEDAFTSGDRKPPVYEEINKQGITIAKAFSGTNGKTESAYIGLIAHRKLVDTLQLFIILEGSQGEDFEFLGGLGGASWLTNFQAGKKTTNASDEFNLDNKYLVAGNGDLTFHDGYFSKISQSNGQFRDAIRNVLDSLKIESMENSREDKSTIDGKRGYTIQVYIVGHSQGGGLVQVAAPYYTTFIGKYLYGKKFDNQTYNTVHAIGLSPARAIGDEYTLKVIQRVMGEGNIFGYCSPMDPVPCVPLGSNIGGHKAAEIGFKVLQTFTTLISHFVDSRLSPLLKAISEVDCYYVDLPIFAYEDPNNILKNYAELSLNVLKNAGESKESMASLEKILKKREDIKKELADTQENYFESHRHFVRKTYYLGLATYHLKNAFNDCPVADYIAAQHFGTSALLKYKDNKGEDQEKICALFNHKILEGDVQEAINRGIEYNKRKAEYLK